MTESEGETEASKAKGQKVGLYTPESDKPPYVDIRRRRLSRSPSTGKAYKQDHASCEHCSWRPPVKSMLHAHHVVPLSCGGADVASNLIVLCPNCHAIAHWVTKRSNLTRRYTGPTTKATLQAWMRRDLNKSRQALRSHLIEGVGPILSAMRA